MWIIAGWQEGTQPIYYYNDGIFVILLDFMIVINCLNICFIVLLRHKNELLIARHKVRAETFNSVIFNPFCNKWINLFIKALLNLSITFPKTEVPDLVDILANKPNLHIAEHILTSHEC